jgi:hypothetical protein
MSQPPQPPYSGEPYPGQPSSGQPYSGQPYQGQQYPQQPYPQQPNPDVPTSVPPQPGYPATTPFGSSDYTQPQQPYGQQPPPYGQPDYAQQGFGQPGFPPPVPPQKKSKVLPIVLTSVAIVLVLCVGGVVALVMIGKNASDKVTGQTTDPTPGGTGPTTETADPTTKPASTVTISEPKTLGGRPKLTDAQFADVAKELQSSLKEVPGATNSVGALYGTVAKQNIVILAAAEAPIDDPAEELTQTFYGAGVGGLKVDNITAAPTGALGGVAKCGSASTGGVDMAICSWADDGSLGMMIWYFKSVAKAKAEFPKLRAEVEKKA